MKLMVNPQTDKGEHTEPENHRDYTHPKKSGRAPNDSLGEYVPVIEENEVSCNQQDETYNHEQSKDSAENRIMSCLGIKNYHNHEPDEEQQPPCGEQLPPG